MRPAWINQLPLKEIDEISEQMKLPKNLLAAIIQQESRGNPNAVRYEPYWQWFYEIKASARRLGSSDDTERALQACSWGLCQVMGSVCREAGFQNWLSELTDIKLNLKYGARHLKRFLAQYPAGINDAISAYNQGSAKKDDNGRYKNQAYVDAVLANKAQLDKPE